MTTTRRVVLGAALALAALAAAAGPAAAAGKSNLYTSTNGASGNQVLAFDRAGDGSLNPAGTFATGGNGTGGGLGNQGALALTRAGRFLYVVNAGSDSISTFAVHRGRLHLQETTSSGGDQPVSLAVRRGLLYALNAGSGTISGLRVTHNGALTPLSGSTEPISGSDPAQVEFSNAGDVLVVTNKATNTIDTFTVDADGRPGPAQPQPSEGDTPFGFEFDRRGHLIVSEAFGGAPGASTVSSYSLSSGGLLSTISASVPDHEAAACWIAITKNGRFAYTTNTGSGSISSYTIAGDGSLGLLEQVAAATGAGSGPTDLAQSASSRVLLALLPGTGSVASYRVGGDGGLTPVDQVGGVPASATGLAAR
ncbi:MAG: lactonase family protein [Solirubrobacterales bacterium]